MLTPENHPSPIWSKMSPDKIPTKARSGVEIILSLHSQPSCLEEWKGLSPDSKWTGFWQDSVIRNFSGHSPEHARSLWRQWYTANISALRSEAGGITVNSRPVCEAYQVPGQSGVQCEIPSQGTEVSSTRRAAEHGSKLCALQDRLREEAMERLVKPQGSKGRSMAF